MTDFPNPQQVVVVEASTSQPQTVMVDADLAQQVVLVDVTVSQGPPGAQGPAGPELPPPIPSQVGMAAMVRDYGAGPVWDESFIMPADVHGLGALATKDQVGSADIIDGSVSTADLAALAVTGAKVAAKTLDSSKWGDSFAALAPLGFSLAKGAAYAGADRRWFSSMTGAEAAGNVGNDFYINAYDNAGNYLSTPFQIIRSSGVVSIGALNASGDIVLGGTLSAKVGKFGQDGGVQIDNAPGVASHLYFKRGPPDYVFTCDLTSGALAYSIAGTNAFGIIPQGITCGVPNSIYLASQAAWSQLSLDEPAGYRLQLNRATGQLMWQAAGAAVLTLENTGLLTAVGVRTQGAAVNWLTSAAPVGNTTRRWGSLLTGGEAAGDVGNDLQFQSYKNDGTFLANVLALSRAGDATVARDLNVNRDLHLQQNAYIGASAQIGGGLSAVNWLTSIGWNTTNNKMQMTADANSSVAYFEVSTNTYLQYDFAGKYFRFVQNNVQIASHQSNGDSYFLRNVVTTSGWLCSAAAGTGLRLLTPGGAPRWDVCSSGSETGGNAGTNFAINCYDDSGNYLRTPLTINRSTGSASFYGSSVISAAPQGGYGYIAMMPGDATHTGYLAFYDGGGGQSAYIGYADPTNKLVLLTTAAGYTFKFNGNMPVGNNGTPLGYQRKTPKYYNVNSWVESSSCDTIQVAQAGCAIFYATATATQPTMFDGFHCVLMNMTGAAMGIYQDGGATMYWVNPAGAIQSGNRNFAHGGIAQIYYIGGVYMLTGSGIT